MIRWRLVIATLALLGATPRVGLYVHQHAHGEHGHVHLDAAAQPRRAALDVDALWAVVRDSLLHHHHPPGHDHAHSHGETADHTHSRAHVDADRRADAHGSVDVAALEGLAPAPAPAAAGRPPVGQDRRHVRRPHDHHPSLAADAGHAAQHWHAGGPLHHLAVPLGGTLQPVGAPQLVAPAPSRRIPPGTRAATLARGPPSLTIA